MHPPGHAEEAGLQVWSWAAVEFLVNICQRQEEQQQEQQAFFLQIYGIESRGETCDGLKDDI